MIEATIVLTKGNINNNHFYLTSCLSLFPPASIGGRNKVEQANFFLKIRPTLGEAVLTDIDGTKNIFRKRSWVGKMFKDFDAKEGDRVLIEKISESDFKVSVVSGGAR
jgi:DNA polymerase-3 subunit epsilon